METWAKIMYEQEERDTQNAINTLKKLAAKTSTKIKNAILDINQPFNKGDLLHILKAQYNIDNPVLTNEVLDNLCDNGILRYIEIENDIWAFVKAM